MPDSLQSSSSSLHTKLKMNIIHITPLILLVIFLCSNIGKGLGIDYVDKSTCLNLQQNKVPLKQLRSYTNQTIPKEAILFVTRKGKELCADPSMPWVIKAVAALDRRTETQLNSKKATNTKKTSSKSKQGKQKNKQNKKKNVKKVPQVKSNKATHTAMSSVVKS
ncbi:lymphotactin-like [Rana temporaria]|uniref:lymphotactin-like n=1 Tax=Rana temporaria TaxID=8407 RepID=UPI001AACBA1E|nr:lymphotactin-like [Rana temporaria]